MEGISIPGWALYLMGTLGAGFIVWLKWLTSSSYEHKENISIIKTELENMNDKLDHMTTKLDLFISEETSFLKNAFNYMKSKGE